jgi:hypothetical protein
VRVSGPAGPPSLLSASARSRTDRRQRLAAWGEAVVKRLRGLGLDVDGCDVDDSRAVFVPDGRLSLALDAGRVEVALELHRGDLVAPRARLEDAVRALELTAALEALPEQFTMGASSEARRDPAAQASSDGLRAMLDRADRLGCGLWLGWTLPREVAAAHAATLDEQLQDAVVALGEVLQLLSRAPEATPSTPRRGRRPQETRARKDDDREPDHRRAKARARERDREQEPESEVEPDAAAERDGAGPRLARPLNARPMLRAGRFRRPALGAEAGVEKGARVRVLEGAFRGKVGVVQALDGKGAARVMLGLLAVRIEVKDLATVSDGSARPRLASSHRRMPVRS